MYALKSVDETACSVEKDHNVCIVSLTALIVDTND